MLLITVENSQKDLFLSLRRLTELVSLVLKSLKVSASHLTIYFTDAESICQLHDRFFQDTSPTDCISFPFHDNERPPFRVSFLGEIFVCPRTAIEYSSINGLDPYDEVMLYLVHGILHLVGFEDQSNEGEREMYAKQENIVSLLLSKGFTLNPKIDVGTIMDDLSCFCNLAR
ncbi:rRNA maturation RNase YbeY [Candidatus Similichlamydia epinepheli]|uniref:rRNA maturation RNase YbeY n=1 Tax=Candidatus Similichlamydia epinepheli TaxID=1903953 RepID=UPI000D3A2CF5|nr:rRNA maturation RNase YbeY [Candidatus Similichlamydia epinepheli]